MNVCTTVRTPGKRRISTRRIWSAPFPSAIMRSYQRGRAAPQGVLALWQSHYRLLRSGKPGERFRALYESNQRVKGRRPWRSAFDMLSGATLALGGTALMIAPLPFGTFVALPGYVMLGRGSRRAAQLLDKTELFGRRLLTWRAPQVSGVVRSRPATVIARALRGRSSSRWLGAPI